MDFERFYGPKADVAEDKTRCVKQVNGSLLQCSRKRGWSGSGTLCKQHWKLRMEEYGRTTGERR